MRRQFISFKRAREYVRKTRINSGHEWARLYRDGKIPFNIPSHPYTTYKNKGWVDWYDWLGKRRPEFREFKKARRFVRNLKITSVIDWKKYCNSIEKPVDIPKNPNYWYDEYIDMYDWLGTQKRKYNVNDKFFSSWSHDMAYVLGFWFADGHIAKVKTNSYIFVLTQNTDDKYLLESIAKKMKSNNPINDYCTKNNGSNYCSRRGGSLYSRLNICSKQIYDDVVRLGGKERKSLDIKFPYVPKKYLPDFIRGLWDGDGTIWYGNYNVGYFDGGSRMGSGSSIFIDKLSKVLKRNIGGLTTSTYNSIVIINGVKSTFYCLSLGIDSTSRLSDFMYNTPSGLFLRRKKKKFLKFGEIQERKQFEREHRFLPFLKARRIARKLGLKNRGEWFEYSKKHRDKNIPSHPEMMYINDGWLGMKDWLNAEKHKILFKNKK